MKRIYILFFISAFAFANCQHQPHTIDNQNIKIKKGLVINQSTSFDKEEYQLLVTENPLEKMITIEGDNIEVNFNDLTLIGSEDLSKPEALKGIAVHIKKGENITIKNLNIKGYRIALQVDSVKHLMIDSCNFSFNYRPDSSAQFDINKVSEAAVIINNSDHISIKNCIISNNKNGVLVNNSSNYQFVKNEMRFNAQVGVYINNSSSGSINYNQIDWNYKAGLWYNQLNDDRITNNTLTHNGSINNIKENDLPSNNLTATSTSFDNNSNIENNTVPLLDPKYPQGELYKIPTKYGVYNFEYPAIFLRKEFDNQYTFSLFGPPIGNWKFVNARNVKTRSLKSGTLPAMFLLEKENPNEPMFIEFEFIGAAFVDEYGRWNKKGEVYIFGYTDSTK